MLERKRNILFLIAQYLNDLGLTNTSAVLLSESSCLNNATKEYQICDNIDLDSVYLDYMSYHHIKFGKYPKIVKKIEQVNNDNPAIYNRKSANSRRKSFQKVKSDLNVVENNITKEISEQSLGSSLTISKLSSSNIDDNKTVNDFDQSELHILPPLREYEFYTTEWKEMADLISR